MNAIGTQKDAVSWIDNRLVDVNSGSQRPAESLGDAATQTEVAEFDIGQLIGAIA